MTKKTEKTNGAETRTKTQARDDLTLLKEKVNSAGTIIMKQVRKLESAQRNAIKSGQIAEYNTAINQLTDMVSNCVLPENATIDEPVKATAFNMDSLSTE